MTDAVGQPWYDEASDEQKSRMWRQRNSSGLGTGAPPPSRYIEETDEILPASELGAGATVTMQRHVHEWSVPEVMVSISPTTSTTSTVFNVADYGAVGNGVTDDTDAIQDAIDAASTADGGVVFLPKGNYIVSDTLTITGKPVSIQGVGGADANLDAVGNLEDADYGSLITWAGGASPVISAVQVEGVHWHSFAIDGVGVATYGIQFDRVRTSHIHNIRIVYCATVALRLFIGAVSGSDDNMMFNFFGNLSLERSPKGLILESVAYGNCCHNQFTNLRVDHSAQYGVDLVGADNNTFSHVFTYSRAGGGVNDYGLRFGAEAYGNFIMGLHGRVYVVTPTIGTPPNVGGNVIFGYDRSNGHGAPTIEADGRLDYTTTGISSDGWHVEALTVNEVLTVSDHLHFGGALGSFTGAIGLPNGTASMIKARDAGDATDIAMILLGGDDLVYLRNAHSFGATVANIAGHMTITDGVTAPGTVGGRAQIYVDTADGDLKVKFGDGTVKTIVVDT